METVTSSSKGKQTMELGEMVPAAAPQPELVDLTTVSSEDEDEVQVRKVNVQESNSRVPPDTTLNVLQLYSSWNVAAEFAKLKPKMKKLQKRVSKLKKVHGATQRLVRLEDRSLQEQFQKKSDLLQRLDKKKEELGQVLRKLRSMEAALNAGNEEVRRLSDKRSSLECQVEKTELANW